LKPLLLTGFFPQISNVIFSNVILFPQIIRTLNPFDFKQFFMRFTIISFCLIFLSIASFGQGAIVGKLFPEITGETLNEKSITIPSQTKGKFTLVGMAYSKEAESDLNSWLNPVYNKFIAKTGMMDMDLDVNIYFIPMFTGVNASIAGQAIKKLKSETNPSFYPYVLFYKGEIKTYKMNLNLSKRTPDISLF
jgi:hypothetical protein